MSRKDILIPIAFSVPIGNDEKIGSFGFGAVAGYTSVKYGFFPNKLILLIDGVEEAAKPVSHEQGFLSYGGFVNMHLGYRYLYFVPSVAVYYQDFGSFEVLGGSKFSISGLSIVPSLGLEGRF